MKIAFNNTEGREKKRRMQKVRPSLKPYTSLENKLHRSMDDDCINFSLVLFSCLNHHYLCCAPLAFFASTCQSNDASVFDNLQSSWKSTDFNLAHGTNLNIRGHCVEYYFLHWLGGPFKTPPDWKPIGVGYGLTAGSPWCSKWCREEPQWMTPDILLFCTDSSERSNAGVTEIKKRIKIGREAFLAALLEK